VIPIASPELTVGEVNAVERVIESGMLADGPEVREFEREFASYCGVDYGVATSNGTTALHAAFEALGIGNGDRVLTTPFSFIASANAIRHSGARPIFADINPRTFNLDPDAAAETLNRDFVDCILVVHLYGLPASLERLRELADDHDIPLVEDAAQAHGAEFHGQRVGSFGEVSCFSFYPTKNMTTGEGGMIVTEDEQLADRAAQFVNHGRTETYEHETLGHNFRMTSIAAALGNHQLDKLEEFNQRRRMNADLLSDLLTDTSVQPPIEPAGRRHVYHQYTIRYSDRDGLASHLEDSGIDSAVYYPKCIHKQPAYGRGDETYPNGEQASQEVLSIPIHPKVIEDDIHHIADTIKNYVAE